MFKLIYIQLCPPNEKFENGQNYISRWYLLKI